MLHSGNLSYQPPPCLSADGIAAHYVPMKLFLNIAHTSALLRHFATQLSLFLVYDGTVQQMTETKRHMLRWQNRTYTRDKVLLRI
jgi:hypothetical protein